MTSGSPNQSSLFMRLAIVAGVLFLLGACLATFLPTRASAATCGQWFNPEWDREESQKLAEDFYDLGDGVSALDIAMNYRECDDALSTRRTTTFILLGAALVVPVGIIFVGGGMRRRPQDLEVND